MTDLNNTNQKGCVMNALVNRVVIETHDYDTTVTHKPEGVEVELNFSPITGGVIKTQEVPGSILYGVNDSWPTPKADEE